MIDPTTMLVLLAVMFGSLAVVIVVIVVIGARASKGRSEKYHAPMLVRLVALLIDVVVLRVLAELIWSILVPNYYSPMLVAYSYLPFDIMLPLFATGIGVLSYFIPYNPFLLGYASWEPSVLAMLLGFFYFFAFDAVFGGRTIGRIIVRIETRHENEDRPLTYREAYYNAVGKSFIIVDIMLGQIALFKDKRGDEKRQVRITQRIAGVVTKDSLYRGEPPTTESQVDTEVPRPLGEN